MHLDDVGQFFDRIQDTGRCFAMNESDMCDIGVIAKIIVYIFNWYLLCFFKSQHVVVEMVIFCNVAHTVAIGSVATNQEFVFRGDGGA